MPFPWAGVCTAGLYSYGRRGEWIGGQPGVFHSLQQFSCPPRPRPSGAITFSPCLFLPHGHTSHPALFSSFSYPNSPSSFTWY